MRVLGLCVLGTLLGLAACGPPALEIRAPDRAQAQGFFARACAGCHTEGAQQCLVPESVARGRLGAHYFEAVPAHRGVALPEPMRAALCLLAPPRPPPASTID